MAQPQQNISIQAPAFQGLNTEDSPLSQDTTFAQRANNAVLDALGRIGARRGFRNYVSAWDTQSVTTPVGATNFTPKIHSMSHSEGIDPIIGLEMTWDNGLTDVGVTYNFGFVNVAQRTVTVVDIPSPYDTEGSVKGSIVAFNGPSNTNYYIFGGTHQLVADPVGKTVLLASSYPGWFPPQDGATQGSNVFSSTMNGDVACAAYGRIWVSGVGGDRQTIYYSDLENPVRWYDGTADQSSGTLNTAGVLNVSQYWPNGVDRIQAIVAHNNMLVVFGRNSILLYGNPQGDPAAVGGIFLQDAIEGMGAVSRDALCTNGSDILFVDDSGVRSLGRSIQEQSVAIGDLTANVRTEFKTLLQQNLVKDDVSLTYWPTEAVVVCNFRDEGKAYILDQRKLSSSGGARVTTWSEVAFDRSLHVEAGESTTVLLGANDDLLFYADFTDRQTDSYVFSYESNPLTFGDSVREKFPKRYDVTTVTRDVPTQISARWGTNGTLEYSKTIDVDSQAPGFYYNPDYVVAETFDLAGLMLYGDPDSLYGRGETTLKRYRINTKGAGPLITLGLDATINGGLFSVQELNVQTTIGRIY